MSGFASPTLDDYREKISVSFYPLQVPRLREAFDVMTRSVTDRFDFFRRTRVSVRHDAPFAGRRTGRDIDTATPDEFILISPKTSHLSFDQFDRQASAGPGQMLLIDARTPYSFQRLAAGSTVCHHLPGNLLRQVHGHPEDICLRPITTRSGLGAALESLLTIAWRDMSALNDSERHLMMDNMVALLPAACGIGRPHGPTQLHLHTPVFQRAVTYIESNLSRPDLCATTVAAAIGVSVGHLHAVARKRGTSVGTLIVKCRLDRCHQALTDPRYREARITEIAFGHGFNDAAHFSRAFRRRYGCTASDFRSQRQAALN